MVLRLKYLSYRIIYAGCFIRLNHTKFEEKQRINKHLSPSKLQEVHCAGNNNSRLGMQNSTLRLPNHSMQIKSKEMRI